ncbi:MAG: L,D-transpeptidase [Bifidobacteriaceae bacterium]|jgi:hypothetical protein|nr:L,D-transpeptidase [Bifidobacteriaceae bacterium]
MNLSTGALVRRSGFAVVAVLGLAGLAAPVATVGIIAPPAQAAPVVRAVFTQPSLAIQGQARVGETATAQVGAWGVAPDSVTYEWLRDQATLVGNQNAYTFTDQDLGHVVTLRVTANKAGYDAMAVTAQTAGPVQTGLIRSIKAPAIKGIVRVGLKLSANHGTWSVPGLKYSYQWYRSGKAIKGATKKHYTIASKDTKKRIRVKVTAQHAGYDPMTLTTAPTRKVPKKPAWVSGKCMEGSVICIDKNTRELRWVVGGKVKLELDARFGCPGTDTRNGVFSVYKKSANWVSTLYHSAMPFSMFFSGGQAVHYSSDFHARGYAGCSHGCVNIRDYNGLKKLFKQVKIGTKVVVYYGKKN